MLPKNILWTRGAWTWDPDIQKKLALNLKGEKSGPNQWL